MVDVAGTHAAALPGAKFSCVLAALFGLNKTAAHLIAASTQAQLAEGKRHISIKQCNLLPVSRYPADNWITADLGERFKSLKSRY
jgi:hypothetical protein